LSAAGVGSGEAAAELRFVAIAPRGLSDLLAQELQMLGAASVAVHPTSVRFQGSLESGYRACLWSRVASRVLLVLEEFEAPDAQAFYRQAGRLDWRAHVDPHGTLACDFSGTLEGIDNSHFGALRLKDAVCDALREQCGIRPDVQLQRPSVRLHAHAQARRVTLALDLAGEGLHRRGYRREGGEAPLRENLAAGVLLRAGWAQLAARGAPFLDPMCGSGTLVIEAAMIAAQRAPGLLRDYFGFLGWRGHDAALWQRLCSEARGRALSEVPSRIRGTDRDERAVAAAIANAQRAGLAALVQFERCSVGEVREAGAQGGLICTNPPYGERLGDEAAARRAHAELGRVLREHFTGWDAAILTAAPGAARELQLRSYRVHELWNGSIACRLLRIDLAAPGRAAGQGSSGGGAGASAAASAAAATATAAASPGAQMLANRLRKNLQHLGRQARREHVSCYRLYDADMPEYAFAIDRYEAADGGAVHLHVQEYAPPASVDLQAARRRRQEMLGTLPQALEVPPERIHLRVRRRQRGAQQYRSRRGGAGISAGISAVSRGPSSAGNGAGRPLLVEEAGLRFLVNLDDYLDTGLFLDHRPTRALLRERARGVRFLNLFCYTATATVFAAAGGARESLSVDLSNHYLHWAAENFRVNGLDGSHHRLERADCLEWLRDAVAGSAAAATATLGTAAAGGSAARSRLLFELIFLDPPTFSNSKRMQGVLDVQRDHPELIERCMQLLAPGGQLIFSTNARRFKLAASIAERWQVIDLSRATLPFDFARNPRIHSCFEIRQRS
jgi:23S rRNA (guanine2069-N7)-methyltransferase / 23S rRNA (guanine2445-N2)-methyltransferase